METLSDKELVRYIYTANEEFAGESVFLLIEEACKRHLTITFKDGEIVYNRL
jgi:hypothetical protein